MKKAKYISLSFLTIAIMSIAGVVKTNVNAIAQEILKNSYSNIKIGKVELNGLEVIADNIEVEELNGNKVGVVNKAKIRLNPFLPARIRKITVEGADLLIKQNKDGSLNVDNIIKNENVSRISNASNIKLLNSKVKYINEQFSKKIEKDLVNVSGSMNMLLQNDLEIDVRAESVGSITKEKEILGLHLKKISPVSKKILSIFSFKNDKDHENKTEYTKFEFKNVDATSELSQFLPFDFLSIDKGKLNGNLEIYDEKSTNDISLYGNLSAFADELSLKDYSKKLTDVKAKILMTGENVNVKGLGFVEKNKLDLSVLANLKEKNADVSVRFKDLPFEILTAYKNMGEKIKVNGNIDGGLKAKLVFKSNEKLKIENIDANISSKNINAYNTDFNNIKISAKKKKDSLMDLRANVDIFKKSSFDIKENIALDLLLDLEKEKGSGNIRLENHTKEISLYNLLARININSFKDVDILINDENMDARIKYANDKIKGNLKTKKPISITKDDINAKNNINVVDFDYDIKQGNLNTSINTKSDILVKGQNLNINGDFKITNNKIDVNASIANSAGKLNIIGSTTDKLEHSYNINGNIEMLTVLNILGMDKRGVGKERYVPLGVKAHIYGKEKEVNTDFNIRSKELNYFANVYGLNINGHLKDVLNERRLTGDMYLQEAWMYNHRLKDVRADLSYANDNFILRNIRNEFLNANLKYDLKSKEVNIDSTLHDYMLYTPYSAFDVNVPLSKMTLNATGRLDDINAMIKIYPSAVVINQKYFGIFDLDAVVVKGLADIKGNVGENKFSGTYDLNDEHIDLNIILDQKISEVANIKDLGGHLNSTINIYGKKENISADLDLFLSGLKYKTYDFPTIMLKGKYKDGKLENLLHTGILEIDNIGLNNKEGKQLFKFSTKFDLANLNLDYSVKDKIIDLSKISEDFSGQLKISGALLGNIENFYSEIKLESDHLNIAGSEITNLILDAQANNDGINIGQGYLEYEKNPVLIEGYTVFKPYDYNFRVVAENFNLDFLKINKNIKDIRGIANLNFVTTRGDIKGKVRLEKLDLVLDNLNIQGLDVYLNMKNKDIEVEKLSGIINNGTLNVVGNFSLPQIPDDFMKTKRLTLGKFDLSLVADKIGVNYKDNEAIISSNLKLKGDSLTGNINLNSANISNLSFLENNKKSTKKEKESYFTTVLNEVKSNILKQYQIDIDFNIINPVIVDIPSYLLINNIYGEVQGQARVRIFSGIPSIIGDFQVMYGKFVLNSNEFILEDLNVKLDDDGSGKIDPYINFKAITTVSKENVEISMNARLSEKKIYFKSSSGKKRDEILSLLAFKGNDFDFASSNIGSNVLNMATETAINHFITMFTNKIGKKIGLTKFEINATIDDKNKVAIDQIFNNASAQVGLQGKLVKDKNIYWNVKTSFPFNGNNDKIKYDVSVSRKINEGLDANLGVKQEGGVNIKDINYYGGINYSKKFNNFEEFLDDISNTVEKREVLIQEK